MTHSQEWGTFGGKWEGGHEYCNPPATHITC